MSKPKERGIPFTDEMVRAILDGRKTETRRVVRWPDWVEDRDSAAYHINQRGGLGLFKDGRLVRRMTCPYGAPGDRLWVREAHRVCAAEGGASVIYRADGPWDAAAERAILAQYGHWRPAIHMPRWASRITLEVLGVRVERLQSITEEGAKAEGVAPAETTCCDMSYALGFIDLWDSINARRGYGWDANPEVRVIRFRRLP